MVQRAMHVMYLYIPSAAALGAAQGLKLMCTFFSDCHDGWIFLNVLNESEIKHFIIGLSAGETSFLCLIWVISSHNAVMKWNLFGRCTICFHRDQELGSSNCFISSPLQMAAIWKGMQSAQAIRTKGTGQCTVLLSDTLLSAQSLGYLQNLEYLSNVWRMCISVTHLL